MLGMKKKAAKGGAFRFRVSDVVEIPLRGTMLRLRLVDGTPSMADLGKGAELRLETASGAERRVRIRAHAVTGGFATQERLDRTRELDVLIDPVDGDARESVEIGWLAAGPVS